MPRLGVSRSFQRTNILKTLSVLENVRLGVQAVKLPARAILSAPHTKASLVEAARRALDRVGLSAHEKTISGVLSHGAPAPARDRDGARQRAEGPAARRAARRHGPGGRRAHGRAAAVARPRACGAADRARHGLRLQGRRPHDGAGRRRGPGLGQARRRCAPTLRCRRPISEATHERFDRAAADRSEGPAHLLRREPYPARRLARARAR